VQDALGTQSLSTLQCRPSVGLLTQQRVKESKYLRTHDKTFLQPGHCLQKSMNSWVLENLHCCAFPDGGQGDYHNSLAAVPQRVRLLDMATRTSIALVLTLALSRRGSSSTLYNVQGSHRHSGRAEGTGAAHRGSEGDNVSDEVLYNFEPFDERLRTREAADSVTDLHVVFSNRTPHPSIHPSIHPPTHPPTIRSDCAPFVFG